MIPREKARLLVLGIVTLLISPSTAQDDKLYDTGDWIPVTPSVHRANLEQQKRQTEAGDRVLNVDSPIAQNYFSNEEYDNRNVKPQNQQFLTENIYRKIPENAKPRKIKFQSDYKLENPAPSGEQVNFYNKDALKQYWKVEQPPPFRNEKNYYNNKQYVPLASSSAAQNYYINNQETTNQRQVPPQSNEFLAVPNVNPQVPAVDALNIYEQFNIPFNRSFYESLNPTFINNDFYAAVNNNTSQISSTLRPVSQKEEVQLVYVPVENLKQNQNIPTTRPSLGQTSSRNTENALNTSRNKQERLLYSSNAFSGNEQLGSQTSFNNRNQHIQPELPLYAAVLPEEQRLAGIRQDYFQQTQQATKLRQQLQDEPSSGITATTTTTPKPDKKRKPHQPPLAVYLSETQADISEVLGLLKNAKSISVQDTVSPNSPKIFIGPSNLNSANGYSKFPLPYLNNVNGKRVNPKIEQLPFFVAPLNYKAPLGYSKIPLPSPHVGSVVISTTQAASSTAGPGRNGHYTHENYRTADVTYQNIVPSTRFNLDYQSTPISYLPKELSYSPTRGSERPTETAYSHSTEDSVSNLNDIPKVTELPNLNPLDLAINEFELDQINNRFGEPNQSVKSPNQSFKEPKPDSARGQTRFEESTEVPIRSRTRPQEDRSSTEKPQSRRRGRPRQRGSTTTTTTIEPDTERYTVLEEFDSRKANNQKVTKNYPQETLVDYERGSSTPSAYEKYSNIENINDYVRTDQPKSIPFTDKTSEKPFSQYLLENLHDYTPSFDTIAPKEPSISPYENEELLRNREKDQQFITSDGIRYSIPNPETTTRKSFITQFDETTLSLSTERPYQTNQQDFREDILSLSNRQNQPDETRYFNSQNNKNIKLDYNSDIRSEFNTLPPTLVPDERFESQIVTEQYKKPITYKDDIKSDLDNMFISPLQDPAVRSLLQPNLLAPSSKQISASTQQNEQQTKTLQPNTEELSTTIRTRGRTRGRQPTTTSVPRRAAVGRRRPTRPTTERIDVESYSREEYQSPKLTTRQRFRTRSRPTQITTSDITSSTESELKAQTETTNEYIYDTKEPQSFMQFEAQIIDEPQFVTGKPASDDESVKEYHQLYSALPGGSTEKNFILEYENTSPVRATPASDITITNPETDRQKVVHANSIDENENLIRFQSTVRSASKERKEETTRRPTVRSRTRGRSRFTTTTARSITRSSTYRTSTIPNENSESNVKFVGEIRPKYNLKKTTTPSSDEEPETTRSRVRSRVRVSNKTRVSQKPSENEVSGIDGTEQITRRSSIVRTRNRGASHYRPTQSNKRNSEEDANLAEQNYPKDFLQKLGSSPKSSGSKSVEENEEDQTLYASINRPSILPVPEGLVGLPKFNHLETVDKPYKIKANQTEKSYSEPEIVDSQTVSTISDTSEEIFRQLTEAEETVLTNLEKMKPKEESSATKVSEATTTQFLDSIDFTEATSEKPKGKRRGVWKVIRHRVADPLETAESQNYQSVINAFQAIEKLPNNKNSIEISTQKKENISITLASTSATETTTVEIFSDNESLRSSTPTTNENIFDTIYNMFGVFKVENPQTSTDEPVVIPTTISLSPTFPQEITEEVIAQTTEASLSKEAMSDSNRDSKFDTVEKITESVLTTKPVEVSNLKQSFEVEPWEMKAVKTSTSTEVSHETEICYKGRCIKAKNKKKAQ